MMINEGFLQKQRSQRVRDVLNYLNGYFSSFEKLRLHLEDTHGAIDGKKLNYKLDDTVFAINVRRREDLPFRADVRDPERILKSRRVDAAGQQYSKKSYRFFEFGQDDKEVESAKEQFTQIINYHLLRLHNKHNDETK